MGNHGLSPFLCKDVVGGTGAGRKAALAPVLRVLGVLGYANLFHLRMIQMQPWPLVGLVKITFGSINLLKTYLVDGYPDGYGCHHSLPRDG